VKKNIFLLFIVILFLLVPTGCEVKKVEEVTDAERFTSEFSVTKNNPYHYIEIEEVLEIFENGTGIILFADPDSEKDQATVEILTEVFIKNNITKVYYYNPKRIRDNNTKEYQQLIKLLEKYQEQNNNDNDEVDENETIEKEELFLYLPDIYFVKNGTIIGHNNDIVTMELDKEEFLTEKQRKQLKQNYEKLIKEWNAVECTDDEC